MDIPNGFYRVSCKALIWNETGEKFLIIKEDNGWWELPGGAIDFGETPSECIKREVKEEMGLEAIETNTEPYCVLMGKNMRDNWAVALVYETKVKNFKFIPSDECLEMKFVDKEDIKIIKAWRTVTDLANKIYGDKN